MRKRVIGILALLVSFGTGFFLGGKMLVSMINDDKRRMNRNLSNMTVFNDWLDFLYSGGNVAEYFLEHGYGRIMIYGNGYIGARLIQALKETEIEIAARMDKNPSSDENGTVAGSDSEIPDVDCIVITPVFYFDEIYHQLQKRTDIPIVSIQTVIEKR